MLQFDPFLSDLSQNPHRVAQLLEALSIGVVVHQSDGRVLFMNRMGRVLLNLSAENRPDPDDLDRVYPFQRIGTQQPYPPTESPIALALTGQASTAEDIELADVLPVRYLKVSASPLFSPITDQVEYVMVVLEDITRQVLAERVLAKYNQHLTQQVRERTEALQREVIERHKTELALRQSQKRFQSLANMLPGSIFPWYVVPMALRCLSMSPSGWSRFMRCRCEPCSKALGRCCWGRLTQTIALPISMPLSAAPAP
ncbi:MAG: hypothetical protein IGR92_02565 [Leptolyngbyaceae cyanobacterium T60_A2020_046]|nr:hypothetical protein [Leptolyngbyaceae cyanobacterium T60_A2020_046]